MKVMKCIVLNRSRVDSGIVHLGESLLWLVYTADADTTKLSCLFELAV